MRPYAGAHLGIDPLRTLSVVAGSMGFVVTALYRRYRPETYSEMIGQSQVTEPLMTALRTGRVGHAYLFSGPRGCGKTSSARILARCLNCVEGPTDTPCGVCPSCIELGRDGGGSLDVIEIDAASHGGVDDARDLRERAIFAPARDRFKIFIIDEAHMVTKEGFNALLKIVEEPPEHVKFIFATTEPEKVIGTIRSRTHHYPFRLIPPAALLDYVQLLCESEGVGVDAGVLPLIVRAGGGSARDTLSILDQLIAGSEGNTVDYQRAVGLLGFTHEDLLDEAVAAFRSHDAAAAFGAVDRVVQSGQDPQRFVEDLLERFRDLIVIGATNVDGAAAVFRGVPEDQLRRMFEQSQAFHQGELSRLADTFAAGLDRMRGATAPRLQLELMVARALIAANAAPAPAVLAMTAPERPAIRGQMREAQAAAAAHTHATSSLPPSSPPAARPASFGSAAAAARALLGEPAAVAVHPADPLVAAQAPREEFVAEPEGSAQLPDATGSETEPESSNSTRAEPLGTIEQIRAAWPAILQRLLEQNRSAWLAARAVNPLALLAGGLLGIAFEHQTELEVFLSGDTQPALAGAIESVTGIAVRRYHPRPSRAGDQPRPTAELDDAPAAAAQTAPAQLVAGWPAVAGHSTGSKASGSSGGGVVAGGDAEMTFGAAGIAPLAPGLDDVPEPPEDGDFEPQSHFVDQPGAAEIPDAPDTPEAPELPTASSAPSFTRYGEAVVREVLAATFVEELPRDPGTGR